MLQQLLTVSLYDECNPTAVVHHALGFVAAACVAVDVAGAACAAVGASSPKHER